jgi:hypothetical protein
MAARIDEVIELLEAELAAFAPECVDGSRALELVERYAQIERLGSAGKALALRQVTSTRAWKQAGPYRDASAWLAAVSGTTIGSATAAVAAAERVASLPATEAALRAGELSGAQVEAIADAATADPGAERVLLESARRDGVRGLRDTAARVKAAACTDEVARESRIRAARSLRHWTDPDGAGRLDVRGPVTDVARVLTALEPFEKSLFDKSRTTDEYERQDAYTFDALVAIADASLAGEGEGVASSAKRAAPPHVVGVVRVDHSALVRGHTEPGEICELAGIGPIPVHEASRLLDDAFVKAVTVRGTDVVAVSHLGRSIPARLRTAVEEIYQECCIEGCHERRHLEIDHNVPIEAGGRTELANLSRPCTFHHRYKHRHDLRLAGVGTHKVFVTIDGLPPPCDAHADAA